MKTTDYPIYSLASIPWVMLVPVISTAHIRKDDHVLLTMEGMDGAPSPVMAFLDPGHLLNIDDLSDYQQHSYSDAFLHLIETYHNLGFHYLRLDPDGDVLDDLPQFEW